MAYQKQTWVNDVTEVDATHMNHIEDGIEKAYGVKLLAVTDEEPSECSVGDKYFNTTTNKIYDAVDTDTWDDEGYDAESGVFYVVFEEQAIYTYNGITLIGVGSSGAGGESIPIATILAYGGTTAPEGYLLCDGTNVSRTTYAELFALIGTTYGQGDGSTTFGLPNLKGRVLVGLDANDNSFNYLGKTGGEKKHTLTIDEMPSHTHEGLTWVGQGSITLNGGSDDGYNLSYTGGLNNSEKNNIYTKAKGGGQAHNILQPYIVVNFIIKATSTTPITANVVNEESQSTTDTYSCDYVNENIPTKSNIIETTTSGNIKCYKYSDGTMIATGYNSSFNISAGSGSPKTFDLPTAFKDTDYVVNASIRDTGAYWSQVAIAGEIVDKDTIQVDTWNDAGASATVSVQFIAIGKWK